MNKTALQKFAIWAHRELIQLAQKHTRSDYIAEKIAYAWFRELILFQYLNKNQYLERAARKSDSDTDIFRLESASARQILAKIFEEKDAYATSFLPAEFRLNAINQRLEMDIPTEDWKYQAQILGWLYQFYNTESKERIFFNLKKDIKIQKSEIPTATQLFTPDWIVRYMVENTLGRLFITSQCVEENETKRISAENELAREFNWQYYVPETKQSSELRSKRKKINAFNVEQIRILDPCVGCGHILLYAFDVLIQIYEKLGQSAQNVAAKILNYHLFGLDIDNRSVQLARFAIMMKARQYDPEIFHKNINLNIHEIKEISPDENHILQSDEALTEILSLFHNAKEYGSIIKTPTIDFDRRKRDFPKNIRQTLDVAKILSDKYDVVLTNPPYMGRNHMNSTLANYVKTNYPDSKSDLFAVFIERCIELTKKNGYLSMITQHSWMFLSSFELLRSKIQNLNIINLLHLGTNAFEEFSGEVVQTACFVLENSRNFGYYGTYYNLLNALTPKEKEKLFLKKENRFISKQENFLQLPGAPIAYWLSDEFMNIFKNGVPLKSIADSKQGLATADNQRFLRYWHEVNFSQIQFDAQSIEQAAQSSVKWFPYNKGGEFRKWYGNNDYVVNWKNNGFEIRNFCDNVGNPRSYIRNPNYYFRECASWSLISTGVAAFRHKSPGQIFDVAGMSLFSHDNLFYLLALGNSKVGTAILRVIAPTINFQCGDIANIPVIINQEMKSHIEELVLENIHLAKNDWDSFETSWGFKKHPLL